MKITRLTTLALAAVLALGAATAAQARPAACLWAKLTQAQRNAIVAAGVQGGPDAAQAAITDDDRKVSREACGYGASPDAAVTAARAGVIYQKLTEYWLAQNQGIPAARLDSAWRTIDSGVKARFEALVRTQTVDPDAVVAMRVGFAKALGMPQVPAPEIADKYMIYAEGRTLQAIFEPQL